MIIDSPWDYSLDHDLPESSVTGDRNHLRIRARIPESPVRPRPDQRFAPSVGLRRRKDHPFGRRRPTAGRRPSRRLKSAFRGACAPGVGLRQRKRPPPGRRRPTTGRRPPRRLKSAFQGAARQASASANAKDPLPVGAGRPSAEGLPRPNSFGTHGRRPHSAPSAPGVGLRQRKRPPPGRRRPTIGRRPPRRLKSAFQGACAPGVGLRQRKDHPFGRRRPTIGRRPSRRLKSAFQGACAPGVGLRQRKRPPPGRRRPTIGRRPPQAEFIRHPPRQASASANAKDPLPVGAGRPPAEGLHAD
jgi:hypothetical protein